MRLACALVAAITLIPAAAAGGTVMRIGRRPPLPSRARVIGPLAASTALHVTVTLRPRDPAALAAYAQAVSRPGSGVYRRYLTPAQFGRRFGAAAGTVRAVERELRARGMRPGRASAGALSIPVRATAGRLEHGFSVALRRVALPGRRTAVVANAAPALGGAAAEAVQSVIGLAVVSAPHPLLARHSSSASAASGLAAPLARGHVATGGPAPCAAAQAAAASQGAHTADQIATAYGFPGLYRAGDLGSHTTVAIYELEPVDRNDISTYQSCYHTHTSIRYVRVDGGAGTGAGTGEAALDIENLLGLAPEAKVIVYQGQNSSSGAPGSGPYDTFSAIINQDRAQVVSISWGECEAALGGSNAAAENTLFEQAAVEGQTIVAADGDSGSEDCSGGSMRQTQLAVDDPSSQPFVTGVGGTTLSAIGPRPSEGVWNTGPGAVSGPLEPGASGGGISDLWQMPAGQRDAAPFLHVLGAGVTGAQCGHPGGYCREVPDVSADADPTTGYVIYWNGSGSDVGEPQGWQAIGGTSAAAPVWAALMALADSSRDCARGPVGYALPALYRAAGAAYADDFNDVVTGNNDFTGTNGGRFAAGVGYDEATGLGTPNAAALVPVLCGDRLAIGDPGRQRAAVGASVSLHLRATDVRGATVRFHALRLPPGLSVNSVTGWITGRPRRAGTYHVTAIAQDGQSSYASAPFAWTVGAATRILGLAISGIGYRRPSLSFTVATGAGAPALRELLVSVPKGFRIGSGQGIGVAARGALRFDASLVHGALVIELARAFRRLRVTLAYPALQTSASRLPSTRGPRAPQLTLTVLEAGHCSSRLRPRL